MNFSFNAGFIEGNMIYYSDNFCNSLSAFNLKTNTINFLCQFPDEKENQVFLHKKAFRYGEQVVFIPETAKNIHILNIRTKEINAIPVEKWGERRFSFCDATVIGDSIWIMPGNLEQKIVKYSFKKNIVEYITSFKYYVDKSYFNQKQLAWRCCNKDEIIYLGVIGSNKIISFNTLNNTVKVIESSVEAIDSIYYFCDSFWICSLNGKVYKYDLNKYNPIKFPSEEKADRPFVIVHSQDPTIYFIPSNNNNQIYVINESNEAIAITNLEFEYSYNNRFVRYENWCQWNDKIVLFTAYFDKIVLFDRMKMSLFESSLSEKKQNMYTIAFRIATARDVIMAEGELCSLDSFVNELNK